MFFQAEDGIRDLVLSRGLGDVDKRQMLLCVACGYQAALMAPTEILARQHSETLAGLLRASRVRYRLLTGGLTAKERESALAPIAAGAGSYTHLTLPHSRPV